MCSFHYAMVHTVSYGFGHPPTVKLRWHTHHLVTACYTHIPSARIQCSGACSINGSWRCLQSRLDRMWNSEGALEAMQHQRGQYPGRTCQCVPLCTWLWLGPSTPRPPLLALPPLHNGPQWREHAPWMLTMMPARAYACTWPDRCSLLAGWAAAVRPGHGSAHALLDAGGWHGLCIGLARPGMCILHEHRGRLGGLV